MTAALVLLVLPVVFTGVTWSLVAVCRVVFAEAPPPPADALWPEPPAFVGVAEIGRRQRCRRLREAADPCAYAYTPGHAAPLPRAWCLDLDLRRN